MVVVLPNLSALAVELALSTGATAAIDERARPEEAIETICAAVERKTVLPSGVVHQIVHDVAETHRLSLRELEWLRALDMGRTVGELASQAGYSEREMYRHLNKLYARLGVRNRREALSYAERAGFIG